MTHVPLVMRGGQKLPTPSAIAGLQSKGEKNSTTVKTSFMPLPLDTDILLSQAIVTPVSISFQVKAVFLMVASDFESLVLDYARADLLLAQCAGRGRGSETNRSHGPPL